MTARITIPEPLPVPAWSDSEVARLLAISSPPAFTISTWSSSSTPDFISHYQTSLTCIDSTTPSPIRSLAIEAATILDKSCGSAANFSSSLPFTTHPYIYPTPTDAHKPCPFSSYSLTPVLLPSANHREDRQRLTTTRRVGIALWSRYEVGESPPLLLLDQLEVLGQITALLPLWTERSDVTQRDMLDMGSWIHGMRLLRPYRELQLAPTQSWVHTRFMSIRTHNSCSDVRRSKSYSQRDPDVFRHSTVIQTLTERDDSTSGTGHHTAGAGDSFTGAGDGITGAGYDFMKSNVVSAILPHVTPPRNGIDSQLRGRVWGSKRVALRVHLPGFHEKWQTSVFQGHELVVVELTIAFDKNGECFHAYKATDKVGKTRIVPPEDVNKIERSLSEVARHESMETS
ncbi:hypothetical protein Tco_1436952 [Tanacetum coccineum]